MVVHFEIEDQVYCLNEGTCEAIKGAIAWFVCWDNWIVNLGDSRGWVIPHLVLVGEFPATRIGAELTNHDYRHWSFAQSFKVRWLTIHL